MAFLWTDELRQRLRELHAQLNLNFAEIAAQLGTTKNAVSGAANRLGLIRRVKVPRSEPYVRPSRARERPAKETDRAVQVVLPTRSVSEVPMPVSPKFLWDLDHRECKWPMPERVDGFHVHCAAPKGEEDPTYCAYHRRLSMRSRDE